MNATIESVDEVDPVARRKTVVFFMALALFVIILMYGSVFLVSLTGGKKTINKPQNYQSYSTEKHFWESNNAAPAPVPVVVAAAPVAAAVPEAGWWQQAKGWVGLDKPAPVVVAANPIVAAAPVAVVASVPASAVVAASAVEVVAVPVATAAPQVVANTAVAAPAVAAVAPAALNPAVAAPVVAAAPAAAVIAPAKVKAPAKPRPASTGELDALTDKLNGLLSK